MYLLVSVFASQSTPAHFISSVIKLAFNQYWQVELDFLGG